MKKFEQNEKTFNFIRIIKRFQFVPQKIVARFQTKKSFTLVLQRLSMIEMIKAPKCKNDGRRKQEKTEIDISILKSPFLLLKVTGA